MSLVISEHIDCGKNLLGIWETSLYKNNVKIILSKLARNSVLLLCFPLLKTKNSNLHKVGGLVTKSMLVSIDFYFRFFLHAILIRIVVWC